MLYVYGMQVHPCGQYRKNTVLSILEAEHKTGPLFRILFSPEGR